MKRSVSILLVLAALAVATWCLPEDDLVTTSIPGYPHDIYSGYLDISVSALAKSIHYVYFESQDKPSSDPLIVWLTGGPACSSMMAMVQENGPFTITPGSHRLVLNEYAWNRKANMVYLEGPAGVGYSQTANDNETITDEIATEQFLTALSLFIERYSRLKKNQIYIAASGYGAVFAAHLARAIIDRNNDPAVIFLTKLNIKGLLLGNPCVYPDECFASGSEKNSMYHYEFLYKRGFLLKKAYYEFLGKCATAIDPVGCYLLRQKLDKQFNDTSVSAYNVFSKCYYSKSKTNSINLGCEDEDGAIEYFNDPSFRQNWNIRAGLSWQPCNRALWMNYHGGNGSFHLLKDLIADNMRVWIYSGDMDSTIPFSGTRNWVNVFKSTYQVPVLKNWREWWLTRLHDKADQVAGFIWELQGLTVATVKGSGFKVAYDQPEAAFQLVTGFLAGKTLPYKSNTQQSYVL